MQDDQATVEVARRLMREMRQLLQEASLVANAADTCAERGGDLDTAVRIMMNFEDPAARAQQIFRALLLLKPSFADAEDR